MRRAWLAVRCGVLIVSVGSVESRAQTAPTPAAPALPESTYIRTHYEKRSFTIPMRDGIRLYTVAYVPRDASPARRYPIVLQRSPFSAGPYETERYPSTLGPDPFMLRDGYIFVQQEVRGRYLSEGAFENVRPLRSAAERARRPRVADESSDAYDTVAWLLRNLPAHNGRVGLLGVSYGGYYAAAAMLARHPAVVATSLQAPVMDFYFEDFHHNGAFVQAALSAVPIFGAPRPAPTRENWWLPAYLRVLARDSVSSYDFHRALGPLANAGSRYFANDAWWGALVAHPDYDAFWRARAMPPRLSGITHPVLVVGGWFDAENLYGTLAAYRALRERSPGAPVTLAMGPFGHRDWSARDVATTVHGSVDFGDSLATRYQREIEAPFFRRHLKGEGTAPRTGAHTFDSGAKGWMWSAAWPAGTTLPLDFYLAPDGALPRARPSRSTFAEYVSDPASPVPARCTGDPRSDESLYEYATDDQRCITGRADVAVFRSAPLERDITFAGPIRAQLAFSSTGTDADVVVKVIDVRPDGYEQLVRADILRARYRRGFARAIPLTAGARTALEVPLLDVHHTFRTGHRIMVHVQGSMFPLFDRNPGRFVPNVFTATERDFAATTHRLWLGGANASRIRATVRPTR